MSTNDDLTTRLHRQLHDQVDDLHGAPLTLESVRGRAHSIRRTRRLAAAGIAAVAVAAIAVPAGLAVSDLGRADRSPVQPVEQPTEAVDPTPAPTPNADGTFPLTLDVPEGEVPATGYLTVRDEQYVTPESVVDLPGRFAQIAPYDGGWVGIRVSDDIDPFEVVVMDADFEEVSATPSGAGLVTSSDGTRVAWVEAQGNGDDWTVVNAPVDGGEPLRVPTSSDTQVEGFLANDTVAVGWYDGSVGTTYWGQATPQGEFDAIPLGGYQTVGGVSEPAGLVAGQTEFRGDSTCSEVRRTDAGQEQLVYRTCDHRLGAFSPDGQLLIGLSSYSDFGSPSVAILEAGTGRPVVEWVSSRQQQESAVVHAAVWEDDDTVVAVVEQGAEQQVLRFELDGSVTRSGEALPSEMSIEYYLPAAIYGQ